MRDTEGTCIFRYFLANIRSQCMVQDGPIPREYLPKSAEHHVSAVELVIDIVQSHGGFRYVAGTCPLRAYDTISDIVHQAASARAVPRGRATTSAYGEKETENRCGESRSLPPAGAGVLPVG